MPSAEVLEHQTNNYLILADQLKAQYGEIDEDTLRDTLEGISEVPELICAVVRSMLEDEAFVTALKLRISAMQERLERLTVRSEKKRELALWSMLKTGIERIHAEDVSLFVRQGQQRLEVTDEASIPGEFYVHQPARLDRSGLIAALKRGDLITGASLVAGATGLTVRVK